MACASPAAFSGKLHGHTLKDGSSNWEPLTNIQRTIQRNHNSIHRSCTVLARQIGFVSRGRAMRGSSRTAGLAAPAPNSRSNCWPSHKIRTVLDGLKVVLSALRGASRRDLGAAYACTPQTWVTASGPSASRRPRDPRRRPLFTA